MKTPEIITPIDPARLAHLVSIMRLMNDEIDLAESSITIKMCNDMDGEFILELWGNDLAHAYFDDLMHVNNIRVMKTNPDWMPYVESIVDRLNVILKKHEKKKSPSEIRYGIIKQPEGACVLIDDALKYLKKSLKELDGWQKCDDVGELQSKCDMGACYADRLNETLEKIRERASEIRQWGKEWKTLAKKHVMARNDKFISNNQNN